MKPEYEFHPRAWIILRVCIFRPYREDAGPIFSLVLWDTGQRDGSAFGKAKLGYRLCMIEGIKRTVLFEGEDYFCSPCYAIDSNEAMRGLMLFLTLRPGDTDSDYFKKYNASQFAFCDHHAEALSLCVTDRFGEE